MTHTFEKEEQTIIIDGVKHYCNVEATIEADTTAGCIGYMKSGSSCYEDLGEPPSPDDIDVTSATCTVEIYDANGKEIGTLKLDGVEWFEGWFDVSELDFS